MSASSAATAVATSGETSMDLKQWENSTKLFAKEKRALEEKVTQEASERARAEQERVAAEQERERVQKEYEQLRIQAETRDKELEQLREQMKFITDQKKREYSKEIDQLDPYLSSLKKENDTDLNNSVDQFKKKLSTALENAFMNHEDMAMFRTIKAAASRTQAVESDMQVKSSQLEEWYQTTKKTEDLKNQAEAAAEKERVEHQATKDLLGKLQIELDLLKKRTSNNMKDSSNHFHSQPQDESEAMETSPEQLEDEVYQERTINAAASSKSGPSGFLTLFDGASMTNWRSRAGDFPMAYPN